MLNIYNVRIYINESVQRDVYKMLRGCVDVQLATLSVPRSSQPTGHSGTVDVLLFTQFGIRRILDVSEFWVRRSSAALGALSAFDFLKNMPTKMTLWTRVIYTSWNWGWKSLDTLGSRLTKLRRHRRLIITANFQPRSQGFVRSSTIKRLQLQTNPWGATSYPGHQTAFPPRLHLLFCEVEAEKDKVCVLTQVLNLTQVMNIHYFGWPT